MENKFPCCIYLNHCILAGTALYMLSVKVEDTDITYIYLSFLQMVFVTHQMIVDFI